MNQQPGGHDRQADPDPLGGIQRWLLRSSARNMRRELGDQFRRSFGRRDTGEVWDTATNEIPPGVGEAPECQWCPICRAARQMRESGPGLGEQLSGAGNTVAAAVQDAISALDGLLARASGSGGGRDRGETGPGRPADSGQRDRDWAERQRDRYDRAWSSAGTWSSATAADPGGTDPAAAESAADQPPAADGDQPRGSGHGPGNRS